MTEVEFLTKKLEKSKERRIMQKIKLGIAFEALERISLMESDAAPIAKKAMKRIYGVNKLAKVTER